MEKWDFLPTDSSKEPGNSFKVLLSGLTDLKPFVSNPAFVDIRSKTPSHPVVKESKYSHVPTFLHYSCHQPASNQAENPSSVLYDLPVTSRIKLS